MHSRFKPAALAILAVLLGTVLTVPAFGADADDPYKAILTYDLDAGMSRKPQAAIEEEIRAAAPEQLKAIEAKLLEALNAPAATYGCKQFVCRMLRRMGTEQSVPALAKLLTDKSLSHMARFALQYLPTPKAGEALREALGRATGDLKIGVVSSLGFRRERAAVADLARLVAGADKDLARAAISALGQIGGADAAMALAAATVAKDLQTLKADAYLMCADAMVAEGHAPEAAAIYRQMADEGNPTFVRLAAFRGLVLADKGKAIPTILPLIKDKNVELQRAVGKFIVEMPGPEVTQALAEQLPGLPAGAQVIVLGALETRADKSAAPAVARAVESQDDAVRLAAVRALAVLGGAKDVDLLMKTATAEGDVGKAATDALSRLGGEGVGPAIVKALESPDAAVRARGIEIVTARQDAAALPAALKATADADAKVRLAAYKALGTLGGEKELPPLVDLLVKTASDAERSALEQTVTAAAGRAGGDAGAAPVIAGLSKAPAPAKAGLLAVLSRLGGGDALKAVRTEAASADADVKKAAIRALADWKDAAPMADLLDVAKQDPSAANQVLALRGYIRMVAMDPGRAPPEATRMLAEAMGLAKRPDEKKAALSALPKFPCDEALKLATSSLQTPGLAAEAKQAADAIRGALVRSQMKVSAEPGGGEARNAIDGNPGSRWSSGRPMKPGDWFAIDFGTRVTVKSIFLDHNPSSNDWPRSYEVHLSTDGQNWGRTVLTGKGAGSGTTITFPRPVQTQYVKIIQTGSSDSWHWSIHEMRVDLE